MTQNASRTPVARQRCEHGDDDIPCPNNARQYHRGIPICGKHVARLARKGGVGGGGSNLLRRRVRKPQDVNDANRKRANAERDAARRLALAVKATGWTPRGAGLSEPRGHGRKLSSKRGASRVSRMLLTSWIARGWVTRLHAVLSLTKDGADAVGKWK